MAGLMTRKLISIRCDPPLPGNPPTPRRQILSCTVVNIMQKIQQCKRLEGRERRIHRECLRGGVKRATRRSTACEREREREKERRVGASDKDGKDSAAYKSTWMNPHNCNCPSSLTPDRSSRCTHMCARVCVSSGTYPTRIRVSVTSLLTQGCSEIRRLKLFRERLSLR